MLRKHVGTVLNFEHNAAHQDHLHPDSGTKPGFNAGRRPRVLFVQTALGKLFGKQVRVDGQIGRETRGAVRELLKDLGLATASERSTDNKTDNELDKNWDAFLDAAAQVGLAALAPPGATPGAPEPEPNPLELLARLLELLEDELLEHPARKTSEQAIENFAEHPEIAAVLARFQ